MADYDAKQFEPTLVPHFPVAVFTPSSACPHHCGRCSGRGTLRFRLEGPPPPCPACKTTGKAGYARGSSLYCPCCSKSGKDHMPIFKGVTHPPDPSFQDVKDDPFAKARQLRFDTFADRPKPAWYEMVAKIPKETRKERRRRLFGAIVSTLAARSPASA